MTAIVYRNCPGKPRQYIRRIVAHRPLWTDDKNVAQRFSEQDAPALARPITLAHGRSPNGTGKRKARRVWHGGSMKHPFTVLLLVALLAAAIPTAHASQPDNYCTTVNVAPTTNGYTVTATGAGRYARIRDLTTSTTVIATDFGAGATAYAWTGLALDTAHNYQVQVSHTSLTTGYSTSGCVFTPPPPLAVVIASFTGQCVEKGVRLEWETVSEIGVFSFALSLSELPESRPRD